MTLHRLDLSKIRNSAQFFAHLIYTDSIEWSCLSVVRLTEEETTSSSRIFIKQLLQTMTENLELAKMEERFKDEARIPHLENLFPRDTVDHARFSINFFISIGLGKLTEQL